VTDQKYPDRITRWLNPNKTFAPTQVVFPGYNDNWPWWEARPPGRPVVKNMDWLKSEQKRLLEKGIKTKIEHKGSLPDNRQVALFRGEENE